MASTSQDITQSIVLLIVYQKSTITLTVPQSVTLQQLCRDYLFNLTSSTSHPDQVLFKLILKKPSCTISSPGEFDLKQLDQLGLIHQNSPHRILLLTTETSQIHKENQAAQHERRRESVRQEFLQNPVKVRSTVHQKPLTPYRFHQLDLLPNLPFHSRRQELLQNLSRHPSIQSQMTEFKFSVGILGELHPWLDPEILGVNENSGQRIRLRLLTDDLKSVRPFAVVRRVLSHELAHNRYGPHNDDFKILDSAIHKGMLAHDENVKASSHRLGGELGHHYEPPAAELESHCATSGKGARSYVTLPQTLRLSGQGEDRDMDPREAAALAALKRASQSK
ncbi:hypothetical protein O181_073112 [Austropuccinia psidii MF-1]|uniref:WLM domain-containing protein n=1 Tax=Austropuccinia psidii MF-1 TaxID=1389203 RepID=A0A9Q3IAR3_9BASI|nr:hypothetical protein [Austropuccinia psidii MF-1]